MTLVNSSRLRPGEAIVDSRVSKSRFKARALEYFRQVERTGKELVITDHGKPVLKIAPYAPDPTAALSALRGSVIRYDDPTEPVGLEDWESLG
ncbi:MAG TPA: type II toxin-antitoxin system prevent-host-death family antitoxin [Thermoanaerobaculia bacterium]|nr:type II toxin-antitoxin system prevent-host-death family antitoxin [Thermoanaerobaculia bacterium]